MKRNVFNMLIMATDRWDVLDNRRFPFLHSKDSRNFQVPLQSPSLSLWLFTILVMKLWSIFIAPIERWRTFSGRKLARASSLISASNSAIFNPLSNPGGLWSRDFSLSRTSNSRLEWRHVKGMYNFGDRGPGLSVPRTHIRWITSAYNFSSRRSDTLFWLPQSKHILLCTYPHTETHTHMWFLKIK